MTIDEFYSTNKKLGVGDFLEYKDYGIYIISYLPNEQANSVYLVNIITGRYWGTGTIVSEVNRLDLSDLHKMIDDSMLFDRFNVLNQSKIFTKQVLKEHFDE